MLSRLAARLGYDALEVMVTADPVSQDAAVVARLAEYHDMPVVAVHAPNLLLTQRVWGLDPWGKLRRSADMAQRLGARVWWSCTRRSAGSASTPGSSRPGSSGSPPRPGSRSRSRTCSRCCPAAPR